MNTTLLSFSLISIVICAAPGPSMFFVLSNGLSKDRAKGMTAVISLTLANIIWVTLSATGLAALIHNSVIAFNILRIVGAFYLICLGLQIWRSGAYPGTAQRPFADLAAVFIKGLATSLSNPKALIFYISFLPQFINEQTPFVPQVMTLGAVYILIVFCVMSFYAFLGHYVVSLLKKDIFIKWFGKAIATVFISAGLSLLRLKRA